MYIKIHACIPAGLYHVFGSVVVRGHRLLANDIGNVMLYCKLHKMGMGIHIRNDIHEIQFFVLQELFRCVIDPWDIEAFGQLVGL